MKCYPGSPELLCKPPLLLLLCPIQSLPILLSSQPSSDSLLHGWHSCSSLQGTPIAGLCPLCFFSFPATGAIHSLDNPESSKSQHLSERHWKLGLMGTDVATLSLLPEQLLYCRSFNKLLDKANLQLHLLPQTLPRGLWHHPSSPSPWRHFGNSLPFDETGSCG